MPGSIRLFRLRGITVFLHWSWFIIAFFMISTGRYGRSMSWAAAEYVSLFAIVLTHEFGHALACRSVGGRAERIILWPLGGIAFVDPPPRAGAYLWSIVAGPLVNVVLLAPTFLACYGLGINPFSGGLVPNSAYGLLQAITLINLGLLIFNILPIYPLDGGQILRGLLWLVIGPVKSLMVATVIGMIGAGCFALLALYTQDYWLIVLAAFGIWQCWIGFQQARMVSQRQRQPQVTFYGNLHCPSCGAPPPVGPFWRCSNCGNGLDVFATAGVCPHCGTSSQMTGCLNCGRPSHLMAWYPPQPSYVPPAAPPPPQWGVQKW